MNVETEKDPWQKNDILLYENIFGTEKVKKKTNRAITTESAECQKDDEFLDDDTLLFTVTIEMTTKETAYNEMKDHQV